MSIGTASKKKDERDKPKLTKRQRDRKFIEQMNELEQLINQMVIA